MKAKNKWIWVATGSVSGILLGGLGAMYAPEAIARISGKNNEETNDDDQETELQVADVSDDLSFSDAFAEARDEVGAGGVFYWHGGIYGTYYKDEWDAMTAEEQQEFGEMANELFPIPEDPESAVRPEFDETATEDPSTIVAEQEENEQITVEQDEQTPVEPTEAEPQVVDYGDVDGHLSISVDDNGDGVADYIVVDADDSNDLTPDDVIIDKDGNVGNMRGEYFGNLNEEAESNMAPNTTSNETDNSDDDLSIVGYGEYDGHLVVGYGSEGNEKADFVIIDVDDDGKPSADDVVITDDGQTTTLGEIEALDQEQLEDGFDNDNVDDNMDGIMSL